MWCNAPNGKTSDTPKEITMNNWNELNTYAQTKVETRRQEAEEWRLAQLTQGYTQEMNNSTGPRFSLPQILINLVARLRAVWLGA
jgi:hypothetical protein